MKAFVASSNTDTGQNPGWGLMQAVALLSALGVSDVAILEAHESYLRDVSSMCSDAETALIFLYANGKVVNRTNFAADVLHVAFIP